MEGKSPKTVRYYDETDKMLSKLVDRYGVGRIELFAQMVSYFYKTSKDPKDFSDMDLQKNVNRIGGFIKKQEEKHLEPIGKNVEDLLKFMVEFRSDFSKSWNKQFSDNGNLAVKIESIYELHTESASMISRGEARKILEEYIEKRELLNHLEDDKEFSSQVYALQKQFLEKL